MTTNQELIDKMAKRKLGLNHAKADKEIMSRLSAYGFDETDIGTGLDLMIAAEDAAQTQETEYGQQYQATENFEKGREAAEEVYGDSLLIARRMFKDDPAAESTLKLGGRRKRAVAEWLNQARAFYKGLLNNPDWLAKMRGYTDERLRQELALVDQVEELDRVQEKETGEARGATDTRDKAVDAADQWWDDFVPYATVALKDLPEKQKLVLQGDI